MISNFKEFQKLVQINKICCNNYFLKKYTYCTMGIYCIFDTKTLNKFVIVYSAVTNV